MRLKAYLNESYTTTEDVINMIKNNCLRSYLVQTKGRFLYRGMRTVRDIEEVKPRTDRYPKDMPGDLHDKLDDLFKRKFRWKARSEGVFVTGNIREAREYGTECIFFPIGKFEYIWSSRVDDLYSKLEDEKYLEAPEDIYIGREDWFHKYGEESTSGQWKFRGKLYDRTADIYDDPNNDDEDLKQNIERNAEWIPDMSYEEYRQLTQDTYDKNRDICISDLVKTYTNTGLMKALKSNNEIMFKCKSYYAVDTKFENILKKELW